MALTCIPLRAAHAPSNTPSKDAEPGSTAEDFDIARALKNIANDVSAGTASRATAIRHLREIIRRLEVPRRCATSPPKTTLPSADSKPLPSQSDPEE